MTWFGIVFTGIGSFVLCLPLNPKFLNYYKKDHFYFTNPYLKSYPPLIIFSITTNTVNIYTTLALNYTDML